MIGDRGFAASHFFRALLANHLNFVIRVPRKVLVHMQHQKYSLETLAADLQPGQRFFLANVAYGPKRARLNVVLGWEPGQLEPWLLATTLSTAQEACRCYRRRMAIEEQCKDFEQRFRLEACQVQTRDRISRLGLILLLALRALALLVRYPQRWVHWVTARGQLSFVSLALEWLLAPPATRNSLRRGTQSG